MGRLRYGIHTLGVIGLGQQGINGALGGYSAKVLGYGPIAYWPMWEKSGTTSVCQVNTAQNGTYSSDVSTWPVGVGIGDGNTAPDFDGANDYNNIYTVTFRGAFNNNAGTAMVWIFPDNWGDGAVIYPLTLVVDGSNWVDIRKNGINSVRFTTNCNGAFGSYAYTVPVAQRSIFLQVAITWEWDGANTDVECFVAGSSQNTYSPAGQITGLLGANSTVIGAATATPTALFDGRIVHCAIWDRVLSDPAIADLAVI